MTQSSSDYFAFLACPADGTPLQADGAAWLACEYGRYPVVEGIPVLLRDDGAPTAA